MFNVHECTNSCPLSTAPSFFVKNFPVPMPLDEDHILSVAGWIISTYTFLSNFIS